MSIGVRSLKTALWFVLFEGAFWSGANDLFAKGVFHMQTWQVVSDVGLLLVAVGCFALFVKNVVEMIKE